MLANQGRHGQLKLAAVWFSDSIRAFEMPSILLIEMGLKIEARENMQGVNFTIL